VNVADLPTIAGVPAVAFIPVVAGVPSVDGVLAIASSLLLLVSTFAVGLPTFLKSLLLLSYLPLD
jgi:hypothetical protein